jgi:hypothetical protein
MLGAAAQGIGGLVGLGAGAALGGGGIEGQYLVLLQEQMRQQQQMQLVSLHSNIEKSKHETQMAAIRNVRAG